MTTITIERELLERAAALLNPDRSPSALFHQRRDCAEAVHAALAAPDRHAQELLAQDITIANMNERHAQELCAYQVTVDKLKSRRKPMDREEMMDGYCRTPQFNQFVQAFEAGVLYAEYFHGIGEKP